MTFNKETTESLVSIIMPAFNCKNFISESITSVISQTYSNWELVIVDDCSTDGTDKIIKKYVKSDSRVKYFKHDENSGAAIARNTAISKARGKYIAFLDSDDIWFTQKLKTQIKFMEELKIYFTCTSYNKIDENSQSLNQIIHTQESFDYEGVLKTCPGNSTVIYDAESLGKFQISNIKKRNDYVMWLKVIKQAKQLYGIKEVLSSHRIRKGSLSSKKKDLVKYHWKVYREIEGLSLIKSSYLVVYWIIVSLFKLR